MPDREVGGMVAALTRQMMATDAQWADASVHRTAPGERDHATNSPEIPDDCRGHRGHASLSTSRNPRTASRKHIVGSVEGATPDPRSALPLRPGSAGVGHRQGGPHLIGQRDRDAELFLRRSDHPG